MSDLSQSLNALHLRVSALERLVVALAALTPELASIARGLPDPDPPGSEFVGQRYLGSAAAGTELVEQHRQVWRDLLSRIERLHHQSAPSPRSE